MDDQRRRVDAAPREVWAALDVRARSWMAASGIVESANEDLWRFLLVIPTHDAADRDMSPASALSSG